MHLCVLLNLGVRASVCVNECVCALALCVAHAVSMVSPLKGQAVCCSQSLSEGGDVGGGGRG